MSAPGGTPIPPRTPGLGSAASEDRRTLDEIQRAAVLAGAPDVRYLADWIPLAQAVVEAADEAMKDGAVREAGAVLREALRALRRYRCGRC